MAERPVFTPVESGDQLVRESSVPFHWHPGMAPSQKVKNIKALHESASHCGLSPILEISSKSEEKLGLQLSAFNLLIFTDDNYQIPLESAFQGSKVFENGGPYEDLYGQSGREIKKDPRLTESGNLIRFSFQGDEWGLEPKTAFYDWLYLKAVHSNLDLLNAFLSANFMGYTDIEFNPRKSVNCQARSCALLTSLSERGILDDVMGNRQLFIELLIKDATFQSHSQSVAQKKLF